VSGLFAGLLRLLLRGCRNRNKTKKRKNMSKHKKTAASSDLGTIAQHAQDLMALTADVTGEKVAQARKSLTEALEHGKDVYSDVRDEAFTRARAVDEFICDQPYVAVGIGVGVGVFIGFLLRGRRD
jgi:ElaB/YqjD/DUF883 family membrane-anchored ribosome-binding protein